MLVARAPGVADPVEEFQYLDRQLAPDADLVAEFSGTHAVMRLGPASDDGRQLLDRVLGEVMVVGNEVDLTRPGDSSQQHPHGRLCHGEVMRNVPDPWGLER